jgi:hypothetical protein
MQFFGIVKEDRNKYLTLNRCPLGNYQYNRLNLCLLIVYCQSQMKTGKFVSFWIIKFQN